jgi:hypothetical protein
MAGSVFEFRLEGAKTLVFGPPPPGDGGIARILRAPDFCRDPALEHCLSSTTRVQWDLSPIDRDARRRLANAALSSPIADITGMSRGVALVQNEPDKSLRIDVWLPMTDFGRTGLSTFEEWLGLIKDAKNDLNREAVLRLDFRQVRDVDVAAFQAGKRLATTGVELEVRPRAIQWSRDD